MKTIFFDIGNVLVYFNQEKMFEQISLCCGIDLFDVKKLLLEHRLGEQYEIGEIDSEAIFQIFQNHSPKSLSLFELLDAASNIFTPNTDLWPLVEQLKEQGHRLVLLSNTNECHFNHLYSHYPILHVFDHKVLSFEVGSAKPNSQIFQKALSYADEESFYTDDLLENIQAARRLGLDGEVFTDTAALKTHLVDRGFLSENISS